MLENGRPLALGRLKERIVLAVLLLHANEFVSRERLIDELWGAAPPATARKAVNVYVSQLRKTLSRNGHDPIATADGGYRLLVADRDLLDADRVRSLLADARERVTDGDSEAASRLLQEVLALWRGPTLAGLHLESFGRDEVAQLDELRLTALMDGSTAISPRVITSRCSASCRCLLASIRSGNVCAPSRCSPSIVPTARRTRSTPTGKLGTT